MKIKKINEFNGDYSFLSNFYIVDVQYEGLIFPSSENAFQAAKTLNMKEREQFLFISPSQSKKLGRHIILRPNWDKIKTIVMKEIVYAKFSQNDELRIKLFKTQNAELIEGNTWNDIFWGVCNGKGDNHLGKILMEVREELFIKSLINR